MLPAAIGTVHPTYRTPHVAIATYAAASCLLAISGGFRPLAVIASVSLPLVYLAVCLAALKLRVTRDHPPGAFRAPGGPLVPVLGARYLVLAGGGGMPPSRVPATQSRLTRATR